MVERWKEWGVWVQGAALQAEAPAGTALTIYRREGTKPKVVWLKATTVVYFAPDSAIWAGLHGTCKSLLGIWSAEVTHGEGSLGSLAQGQLQVAVIKQCIFMFVYISFHRVVGGGGEMRDIWMVSNCLRVLFSDFNSTFVYTLCSNWLNELHLQMFYTFVMYYFLNLFGVSRLYESNCFFGFSQLPKH